MHTGKKEKCVFCWSGGKDSALALYRLSLRDRMEVVSLLTTVNREFSRISMHGVPESLLDRQAASIGLPLVKMYVSEGTNSEYERKMEETLLPFVEQGVTTIVFGDIFLDELRAYRESNMKKIGFRCEFPLWKEDTAALAEEFLSLGFRTITCCVSNEWLDRRDAGREFDNAFLRQLPAKVDPCGENGEFHTFCYDGPIFSTPVTFRTGEIIFRPRKIKTAEKKEEVPQTGFWYCDLQPA